VRLIYLICNTFSNIKLMASGIIDIENSTVHFFA
jgi:hypothetical protein